MSFRAPLLTVALALGVTGMGLRAQAEPLHEVIAPPAQGRVGAQGRTAVTLTGKNGWKVNEKAPITLKLTPSDGLALPKQKLVRKDLVEDTKERARFDVPFTASKAGKQAIEAEASFAICQAEACKPVKEKVSLAVEVAPAGKK